MEDDYTYVSVPIHKVVFDRFRDYLAREHNFDYQGTDKELANILAEEVCFYVDDIAILENMFSGGASPVDVGMEGREYFPSKEW